MGAAFGCQVYAFELQRKCIDFSRQVVIRNGFESLVNIFHLLVSSQNNEVINIQYPKQEYCDGGFTMSGTRKAQRSRSKQPLIVNGNNSSMVCMYFNISLLTRLLSLYVFYSHHHLQQPFMLWLWIASFRKQA